MGFLRVRQSFLAVCRKPGEDASSKVSQSLIEAHEDERATIVRELRRYVDSLTVLAISLGRGQNPPASLSTAREIIEKARQQVGDIVSDIWALSHRLYPAKVDYLGLAAAAAGFCKEVSKNRNVTIDVHCEAVPKDLPNDISLCLYRVLQEALQNATKHSGSRSLEVMLKGRPNEIQLTVRDSGLGFDFDEAIKGSGFGLIGMRERLKLVDGELVVESQPHRGTAIHAHVPLK